MHEHPPIRPEVLAEYIQAINNTRGQTVPGELHMLITDALARTIASFATGRHADWTADRFLKDLRTTVDHVYEQVPVASTRQDAQTFLDNLGRMFVEYLAKYGTGAGDNSDTD